MTGWLGADSDTQAALLGAPDPLDPQPLVVRELADDDPPDEPPPAWLPAVTVAVRRGPVAGRPSGADVALTADGEGGPGWVPVGDVDEALDGLVAAVTAQPAAAVTLAQVLRVGAGADPDRALVLESLAYGLLQAAPGHRAWLAGRPAAPAPADTGTAVTVDRSGDTLTVTLSRPERHNAIDARVRDQLTAALTVAVADPHLAVTLRGAGPSFSSGGDLAEFGTAPDPAAGHRLRTGANPSRLLARLGPRTTARVHGACVGAGVELAAWAGRVVAAPDTEIWLPELSMGLIPGAGGTASLPRRIGRQPTAWLALAGRRVGAEEARRLGLVDAVEADR